MLFLYLLSRTPFCTEPYIITFKTGKTGFIRGYLLQFTNLGKVSIYDENEF